MVPLCVDLDGTLVRTDTLHESFLRAIAKQPLTLLRIPLWLLQGRAKVKSELAERGAFHPSALPYHEGLLAYLREQQASGRTLVLATAAHRSIAESVARHAGVFSRVLATESTANLKGPEKLRRLESEFGPKGFDYAGDSSADLAVWAGAREAILVGAARGTRQTLEKRGVRVAREFEPAAIGFSTIRRTLRLHQWAKNMLLFIPLILAHHFSDTTRLLAVVAAFFAFSFIASSVYIVNDLLDLDNDRVHPTKHKRPFASGAVPIWAGILLAPLLITAGLAIAAWISGSFLIVMLVYLVVTTLYSFWMKRIPLVDVMTLAFLYTLRVIAGGVSGQVQLSAWLLGFSIFLFFSLAMVKRVSEIRMTEGDASVSLRGRGYRLGEDSLLTTMGVASGYIASLVMALYMQSPDVTRLYTHPEWLWPACPLVMFWISRVWFLTHRGEMPDDPILFALTDFASYILLATLGVLIIVAMWASR